MKDILTFLGRLVTYLLYGSITSGIGYITMLVRTLKLEKKQLLNLEDAVDYEIEKQEKKLKNSNDEEKKKIKMYIKDLYTVKETVHRKAEKVAKKKKK